MKNQLAMLKSALTNFTATGTICPSSRYLADSLTENLNQPRDPAVILEAGAGTGPVTKAILSKMREDDHLLICELSPELCRTLRKNLEANPDYQRLRDQVQIFEGAVQQIEYPHKFNQIVCSLPFLNFSPALCEQILAKFRDLSEDEVHLTYFQYMGLKTFNRIMPEEIYQERMAVCNYLDQQEYFNLTEDKRVFLNVLPANVRHLVS